jgi:hypothetical protein
MDDPWCVGVGVDVGSIERGRGRERGRERGDESVFNLRVCVCWKNVSWGRKKTMWNAGWWKNVPLDFQHGVLILSILSILHAVPAASGPPTSL